MMQRRNLLTALAGALAAWMGRAALPAAAHGESQGRQTVPSPNFTTVPSREAGARRAQPKPDKVLCEKAVEVMIEFDSIRAGMTRADLSRICTPDQGTRTPMRNNTYVYRGCGWIKVQVDFKPATEPQKTEKPEDIITRISAPYLDASHLVISDVEMDVLPAASGGIAR